MNQSGGPPSGSSRAPRGAGSGYQAADEAASLSQRALAYQVLAAFPALHTKHSAAASVTSPSSEAAALSATPVAGSAAAGSAVTVAPASGIDWQRMRSRAKEMSPTMMRYAWAGMALIAVIMVFRGGKTTKNQPGVNPVSQPIPQAAKLQPQRSLSPSAPENFAQAEPKLAPSSPPLVVVQPKPQPAPANEVLPPQRPRIEVAQDPRNIPNYPAPPVFAQPGSPAAPATERVPLMADRAPVNGGVVHGNAAASAPLNGPIVAPPNSRTAERIDERRETTYRQPTGQDAGPTVERNVYFDQDDRRGVGATAQAPVDPRTRQWTEAEILELRRRQAEAERLGDRRSVPTEQPAGVR